MATLYHPRQGECQVVESITNGVSSIFNFCKHKFLFECMAKTLPQAWEEAWETDGVNRQFLSIPQLWARWGGGWRCQSMALF
jgi:hypothetical protein